MLRLGFVHILILPISDIWLKCREAKSTTQPLDRFIHFWLGANTTAERSGAVAYKVIELDKQLGNTAVQYRETQGNESDRFRSYFKNGIMYVCLNSWHNFKLITILKCSFIYERIGSSLPTAGQNMPNLCAASCGLVQLQ